MWGVVCGGKGNPYVESLRLSFFRFPCFVFIFIRRAPRGLQESHIVCEPRDAVEAAIFLLQFNVAHVTPLCGQGSPYLGNVSWPSCSPFATQSQCEQWKLFVPLQTLQYFPCLGLIVTEQFFPLQGGWALAEDADAPPLTCPGLIGLLAFSHSRWRGRLLLVVVCPPNDSPAAAAADSAAATCTRISM